MESKEVDFAEYNSQGAGVPPQQELQPSDEVPSPSDEYQILDHLVRLDYDIKPGEPFIFSFHYDYE